VHANFAAFLPLKDQQDLIGLEQDLARFHGPRELRS
jgi:hypothetical protein